MNYLMRELFNIVQYEANDFGDSKGGALKFETFEIMEAANHNNI